MSVEAISWAFQQSVPHASAKFVLVAMANHADADMRCWPSSAHLCSMTSQDRKTVLANINRLREWGYLVDTGDRRGATKQVVVYQLKTPEIGTVSDQDNSTENGTASGRNDTGNGTVNAVDNSAKQAQKRNGSESGTVPNFPSNSTVFPVKQSQISHETVPNLGHGTIRNHQGTINEPTEAREVVELPDWLPRDAWFGYLDMRREKKKSPTGRAVLLILADLARWRAAGHSVKSILDTSTKNGWTDVYEPKAVQAAQQGQQNAPTTSGNPTQSAAPRKPQGNEPKGLDESYEDWQARVAAFERAQRNGGMAA